MFGVTELETFAGCSSIWFVERMLDPKSMDAEVDAKHARLDRAPGAVQVLLRPARSGSARSACAAEQLDEALEFLRECLDEAIAGGAESRLELTDLQRSELEQGLWRDLEALVRAEAESELPLVPRRFEVSFGSERSAPELQRGLDLETFHLSGKIDRIDLDPFAARGIVWDYKSGKKAHSAAQIERELRLQIPLYMLVLRDLVGVEPLGGLYRPLAGERKARGLLRASAKDDGVPGYSPHDYVDEEDFWAQVERAQEVARGIVERIRAGRRRHDPRGGSCPSWCGLGPIVPGQEAVMAATVERPPTPEQHAAIEARGARLRLRRRGHGQDVRARRALRPRDRRRRRRRLDPRHHLHRARRGGAARAGSAARLAELGRPELPRARRRVDLDDPRLLPAAAAAVPVRRRPRPALPRAGREPGGGAARRGVRRGADASSARGDEPERLRACSPPTARRRCAGC